MARVEENSVFYWCVAKGKGKEWGERQWLWKRSVAFLAPTAAERRDCQQRSQSRDSAGRYGFPLTPLRARNLPPLRV